MAPINDDLADVREVYSYLVADIALNLSCAPFCMIRMAHQHTWSQNAIYTFHDQPFTPGHQWGKIN